VTVKNKDLNTFNQRHSLQLNPYALGLYGCLLEMRRKFLTDEIEVIIDKFDKAHNIAALAKNYLVSDKGEYTGHDLFRITPFENEDSFKTVLPLQAADYIAWEKRKSHEDRVGFLYSDNDKKSGFKMKDAYQEWVAEHTAKNGSPPRERQNYMKAREWPPPQGVLFDNFNLEQALQRHPNGWGS